MKSSRRQAIMHDSPETGERPKRRLIAAIEIVAISVGTLAISDPNAVAQEGAFSPLVPAGSTTEFFLPKGQVSLINVTATEVAGPGYVQVLPAEVGKTSNVNTSVKDQTIASAAFVRPNETGKAGLFNQVSTHMVVDRQGSFKEGVVDIVEPERKLDTRETIGILQPGSKTVVGGFKPNSTAIINITSTEVIQDGYIQVIPSVDSPTGAYSNANAAKGRNTPKLATVRTNERGEIVVFSSGKTHLVIDLQGYLNGVDDVEDVRAIDTREDGEKLIPAGTVLEVKGRPSSIGIVSIVSLDAPRSSYIQALPVENAVLGSASNLNSEAGQIVGQLVFLEFDASGIARIFFQGEGEVVIDIQAYMKNRTDYVPSQQRILDTRSGQVNLPEVKPCEKVVWAESSTTTGRLEDEVYQYVEFNNSTGQLTKYPAPGLTQTSAGKSLEIDPGSCDSATSVIYSVGDYPKAELYKRNLLTGQVTKVTMPEGKYERPDPQADGIYALQTEVGPYTYQTRVINGATNEYTFASDVRDFAISDNGSTRIMIQGFFDGFVTGQYQDRLFIDKRNATTGKFEQYISIADATDENKRIYAVEVSPGGETTAVLKRNGSTSLELHEVTVNGAAISSRKVNIPDIYTILGFRLVDANSAIVSVVDNSAGGPRLRMLEVNIDNGSSVVINTGLQGIPLAVALS